MSNRIILSILLCTAVSCHTLKGQLDALNKARSNTAYFATFVKNEYKDMTPVSTNVRTGWSLMFNEASPGQFDTAITYLTGKAAMSTFTIDMGMTWVMYNHTKYLGSELKSLSHIGKGATSFSDRLKTMMSTLNTYGAENLISNSIAGKNDEHLIADWIIDDGVTTRGHRNNIYSRNYNKIGVGIYKDTIANKWYDGTVFAGVFNCLNCNTITCSMQQEMGWSQYLIDTNQNDPCTVTNTGSSGTTGTSGSAGTTGSNGSTNITANGNNTNTNGGRDCNPFCSQSHVSFLMALFIMILAMVY